MSEHYAKVVNGIVTGVIRADAEFIANHADHSDGEWVQTSYNTRGGKHYDPVTGQEDTSPEKPALRANYAGIGCTYDKENDVFYAPQPFPSWILNRTTWLWEAPVPLPQDGKGYRWDEETKTWV